MNQKEFKEKLDRRFKQMDRETITKIYRVIKENTGDTELALTVSLQLQNTEEFNRIKKQIHEEMFKTNADILREIADNLEDNYTQNE